MNDTGLAVSSYLRRSRATVTIDELARSLGMPRREVEQAIQAECLAGAPLVSSGNGIKWSDDPAEIRDCANRLIRRLARQAQRPRALRRTARRIEDEKALTLWSGRDAA